MKYEKQHFTGERALFMSKGVEIEDCLFDDGESPLKESHGFSVKNTTFAWKYPLWYSSEFSLENCKATVDARAGIWYSHHFAIKNLTSDAPKMFRKCHDFELTDCIINDGAETCWWCHDFTITNLTIKGADYFAMKSSNIVIKNVTFQGKYAFDGCENVVIENCKLDTKDVFWNCKNVTIKNCVIDTEYFGWNSENITLIDCEVHSHQGFCYMKNVKLVRCKLLDTDLSFEYCEDIDAEILSEVESIKNPISGKIKVAGVKELIFDDPNIDRNKTEIIIG